MFLMWAAHHHVPKRWGTALLTVKMGYIINIFCFSPIDPLLRKTSVRTVFSLMLPLNSESCVR